MRLGVSVSYHIWKRWRREVETLFLFRASSSSSVLYDCYERGGERSWRLSFFLWASSSSRVVYDYYERGGKGRWRLYFFYEPAAAVAYHQVTTKYDMIIIVVVAYYMIVMKEVEKGGGDFISFYEPVVVA
jgi:hypothetical protein